MKTKLLLLVVLLCITQISNSQTIDITGIGTLGPVSVGNRNLNLSNVDNITKVDVGAVYKGITGDIVNNTDVQFYDNDEGPFSTFHPRADLIVKHFSPSFGETIGYFDGTFNTFDTGGVNIAIGPINKVPSFYAFIYRDVPNATYQSFISPEISFYFKNGSDDPYEYSLPINTASSERNIKVKIPISELDDGTVRKAIIDITAGSLTKHIEVNLFNLGNSFFLGEYLLENVPGGVSEVKVSIYSPDPAAGEDSGDSFFVNGIVVDVDKVNENPGCTLTQGYWKTHSSCKAKGPARDDTWDALPNAESTQFFLSNQDYCGVFDTKPAKGGKYYILAHQYIAAQLNKLNGANSTAITTAFSEATDFLNTYSPGDVSSSTTLKSQAVALGGILDDYNNGIIGPGHCTDSQEQDQIYAQSITIAPNPISSNASISMVADRDGDIVANLYNSYGALVSPLYNNFVYNEEKISIDFDVNAFENGIYYVKITNNSTTVTKTVVVDH